MSAGPQCQVILLDDSGAAPPTDRLDAAVAACLAEEDLPACQITVLVVDAAESARLHGHHFSQDEATDVMSFPDGSVDPTTDRLLLGDIAVCVDIARLLGPKRQDRQDDPAGRVADELLLYIIHGLLHLLGWDDVAEDDRQAMWQRQRSLLVPLGIRCEDVP